VVVQVDKEGSVKTPLAERTGQRTVERTVRRLTVATATIPSGAVDLLNCIKRRVQVIRVCTHTKLDAAIPEESAAPALELLIAALRSSTKLRDVLIHRRRQPNRIRLTEPPMHLEPSRLVPLPERVDGALGP